MNSEAKKIGPLLATFVVANNMIGSGFFLLPASLARARPRPGTSRGR